MSQQNEAAKGRWQAFTGQLHASQQHFAYSHHVSRMILYGVEQLHIPATFAEGTGEDVGTARRLGRRIDRQAKAFNTRRRRDERSKVARNTVLGLVTTFLPPAIGTLANVGAAQLGVPEVVGDTLAQGIRVAGAERELHNLGKERSQTLEGKIGVHKEPETTFIESGLWRLALHLRYVERTQDAYWTKKHPQTTLSQLLQYVPESAQGVVREKLDSLYEQLQQRVALDGGRRAKTVLGSKSHPIVSTDIIQRADLGAVDGLIEGLFKGEGTDIATGGKPIRVAMLQAVRESDLTTQREVREMLMEGAVSGARNYLRAQGARIEARRRAERTAKWVNRVTTWASTGLALVLPAGTRDASQADKMVHTAIAQLGVPQNEVTAFATAALALAYQALYAFSVIKIWQAGHERTKFFAERQRSLKRQLSLMRRDLQRTLTHIATESLFVDTKSAQRIYHQPSTSF